MMKQPYMRILVIPFVLAFCFGLCVMMLFAPKPRVVVKFPRPDTTDRVYRGADGGCFRIEAEEVSCDSGAKVVPQPVHETVSL